MSDLFQTKDYCAPVESGSYVVSFDSINRRSACNLFRRGQDSAKSYVDIRLPQTERLVMAEPSQNLYRPIGSWPNNFLSNFNDAHQASVKLSSSDWISENDLSEDTELFVNSGDELENELENEVKSRHEADDELASIFGSSEISTSKSSNSTHSGFQRPHNPIIYDRSFNLPRCSAPSIEMKQQMACSFYSPKPFGHNNSSHFE